MGERAATVELKGPESQPPSWLDELPLEVGASVHAMGTRALDSDAWLSPLAGDAELIALKRTILGGHRADVAAALPGHDATMRRVAATISERLGHATSEPSFEDVALSTAEDLCVLGAIDGHWVLVGGVVCFPSMWRLPDKLGLSISRVHDPVPRYADELEVRVDRFLDRLPESRPVWRRNWFIHDVDDLFLPRPVGGAEGVHVPDGLWLRSERQTLMRVEPDAIVFTIRTQQVPLRVVEHRPDIAARMRAAVDGWPDDIAAYRGASEWRTAVVDWLGDVAV